MSMVEAENQVGLKTTADDAEAEGLLAQGWQIVGASALGWHLAKPQAQEADPGEVVRFLDALDPAELENQVLERMGLFSGSTGEGFLEVLKEMARGH